MGELLNKIFESNNPQNEAKFIFKEIKDENGLVIQIEIYAKEIKKMIDVHEKYFSKKNRLNLFYRDK